MKIARLLITTLLALLATRALHATTVIPPTFDELVSQAEVIIDGTVTATRSEWTGEGAQRHIVTYVTVQVNETLKGEASGSYTFRMLGGTVGDETMEVSDAPKFAVGDRDILFVQQNGRQFIPLVGIMHGRFHVERDKQSGSDMVKTDNGQPLTDVARLGHENEAGSGKAGTQANQPALDVASFKAAIRDQLAASSAK